MKALIYDKKLCLRTDYPRPRREPGESLIRVSLAGICATDLEIAKGYMGFRGVPGHEFVGTVEESDTPGLVGKRVVGEINCPCGECDFCRRGLGNHCPARTVLGIQGRDGAFAEYLVLPDANLHPVPAVVKNREAVFVEPLAAAFRAYEQAQPAGGEEITVLGDGRLGILAAKVFAAAGHPVTLLGKHPGKMAHAKGPGVVTGLFDEREAARNADIVVDATGSPSGLGHALKIVRPAGKIVLKTTVAAPYHVDLAPLVIDEVTLIGSRCGPFDRALSLLESGSVKAGSMVSAEYPLARAPEAFGKAAEPGVLKVLLVMNGKRDKE